MDKIISTLCGIVKDPVAWFGTVSSSVAAMWSRFLNSFPDTLAVSLPDTLESWMAVGLTFMSIFYILSKTIILWRTPRDKLPKDS